MNTMYSLTKGALKSSLIVAALVLLPKAYAFEHKHSQFTQILADVVVVSDDKKQTRVNYAKLSANPKALNTYLASLSAVTEQEYKTWSETQQLSFLMNAYNGYTLKLIVDNYADFASGEAKSIRDLGSIFKSPWKKEFFTLLGKKRHLDAIEHGMIREWFAYPRIHAALVCAAVSCPPLRNEAFVADKVVAQLDDQMTLFLSDDSRNTINIKEKSLELSPIFKWYADDFEKGYQGFNKIQDLIQAYEKDIANNPQQVEFLQTQNFAVDYLDYDWRLNDISTF
ncbi:DUF547 domain-containing protein [Paraglaciecola sp. 2405UD69-4]|uniref:DUF547 domain-containing protein n=1 Tax=Paraglaciecola sp. 2405UD69-4 TaxID=3391836 RepID=UPI0039C9D4AA